MATATEAKLNETIFDPATCVRKGLAPVSKNRTPKTHNVYFEIHGDPKSAQDKIVFVMGLNNSSNAWSYQVAHFGKKKNTQVLVLDNRGVGNSDCPQGRYKTTEMAHDIVDLLDYVGWTEKRSLHVVGVSLGGMIVEHVALIIPERILSLNLTSTKAGGGDLPPLGAVSLFTKLFTGQIRSPKAGVQFIVRTLFPAAWLDQPDPADAQGRTRRTVKEEEYLKRYYMTRLQPFHGRVSQLGAAMGHRVDKKQLLTISNTIPKVIVLTGDDDNLINPSQSVWLHQHLPGSEYILFEGGGHAILAQDPVRYNEIVERVIIEAKDRSKDFPAL
ncbi:uncharacterized protein L969DRAFT_86593 [Mixia osmundae IAM 14324]|uniref:AB hydrolase-1 domain-containing protein n=1 Tax=Mixia osmundae (strain CBS 9802 / IAM 14324 / JCM 22182 / KY 12970) TaxID=764103 RepID=G7E9N9_MIXOS|nr:uncharacterized protein L969DRAFT_86593 [Mixia osmundae IAM 14324]KEI39988.1 hypothetical protein L969DRAFT_86593 [Mixia osmundae IAM 14324]GAA99358.1 hypothetical protein E5Q_06053 [Mixia osmundae IAM 14324]